MGFVETVAGDLLKWTYNADQSRSHGQFASGTGGNLVNTARAGGGRPVNPAAAAVTAPAQPVLYMPLPTRSAAPHGGGGGSSAGGGGGKGGGKKAAKKPAKKATAAKKPVRQEALVPVPEIPGAGEAATRDPHTSAGTASTASAGTSISVTASDQDRKDQAKQAKGYRRAVAARQKALTTNAQIRLRNASAAQPMPKGASAAATAAAAKKYGIPTGKAYNQLSPGAKKTAQAVLTAARQLASISHSQANAQRRVDAINAELGRKEVPPPLRRSLETQLKTAHASLGLYTSRLTNTRKQLVASVKAWQH